MGAVQCKICDVRDFGTAVRCAEAGADLIGIHCINRLKAERRVDYRRICSCLPNLNPAVGVVLVTRVDDPEALADMIAELSPTHVQLHRGSWSAASIASLRLEMQNRHANTVKVIGVLVPGEKAKRIGEICAGADLVLVDRQYYGDESQLVRPQMDDYLDVVGDVKQAGKQVFVAGGLTPGNVRQYLERLRPNGVDVQSGVELPGMRGVKNETMLREFIAAVRQWSSQVKEES